MCRALEQKGRQPQGSIPICGGDCAEYLGETPAPHWNETSWGPRDWSHLFQQASTVTREPSRMCPEKLQIWVYVRFGTRESLDFEILVTAVVGQHRPCTCCVLPLPGPSPGKQQGAEQSKSLLSLLLSSALAGVSVSGMWTL